MYPTSQRIMFDSYKTTIGDKFNIDEYSKFKFKTFYQTEIILYKLIYVLTINMQSLVVLLSPNNQARKNLAKCLYSEAMEMKQKKKNPLYLLK